MSKHNKRKMRASRQTFKTNYLAGRGLYIYRNNTGASLILPKKTPKGENEIPANGEFEGDDYYMQMVRTNMLRVVRELVNPDHEKEQNMKLQEEKLILDQPATVTQKGVVEHIVETEETPKKKKKLVEGEETQEVLLTEDPLDGVTILG